MEAGSAAADSDGFKTIETKIPARLDRLPWSRFHWRVVIGLGIVWILDGLEVTIIGFLAPTLTEPGSGDRAHRGRDRARAVDLRRRRLHRGALLRPAHRPLRAQEAVPDHALALSAWRRSRPRSRTTALWFLAARFFTGAGIGGEYSAINSAIDEMIPARARGQGRPDHQRLVLARRGRRRPALARPPAGVAVRARRRLAARVRARGDARARDPARPPQPSPRARAGCSSTAARRRPSGSSTGSRPRSGRRPARSSRSPASRSRSASGESIPFREIARTAFKVYPKRAVLGSRLFIGQAFLYNAVTVTLGLTLTTYLGVGANKVGLFYAVFAAGNFLGPLLLGRLFDTVGRRPMIAGTYLISAVMLVVGRDRVQRRDVQRLGPDPGARGDLLLRLGRRQLRLPDRERDLPDGDPGARDRLLLRDRDRDRRDHRAARCSRSWASRATSAR